MNTLLGMITAAALLGAPLAAQAQDYHGHGGDGRAAAARSAADHGYDASARVQDRRDGDVRYGGYAEGGYHPYADGYGADLAYSYPDDYGTYQPFGYAYSVADDAYYAATVDGGNGYYRYDAPPVDVGLSPGGPPADCGQWVWREGRGAYEWVAAPCR
jgi:hypothetical protein